MEYKLFDDYITLQSVFKKLGIIQSGGNIKQFLKETDVFFNGELEKRRGKKLRLGDSVTIPSKDIIINFIQPSNEEYQEHQKERAEKERVAKLVKAMNKDIKKQKVAKKTTHKSTKQKQSASKKPVRFPGI